MTVNLVEFKAICENCELIKQALSDVDETMVVAVGRMRRATISTYRYRVDGGGVLETSTEPTLCV